QMGMMAQGQEGVFRSVTGRGKAVGTQADPGEKGDQAYAVERSLVRRVQRLSENEDFEFLERIRTRNILHLWGVNIEIGRPEDALPFGRSPSLFQDHHAAGLGPVGSRVQKRSLFALREEVLPRLETGISDLGPGSP